MQPLSDSQSSPVEPGTVSKPAIHQSQNPPQALKRAPRRTRKKTGLWAESTEAKVRKASGFGDFEGRTADVRAHVQPLFQRVVKAIGGKARGSEGLSAPNNKSDCLKTLLAVKIQRAKAGNVVENAGLEIRTKRSPFSPHRNKARNTEKLTSWLPGTWSQLAARDRPSSAHPAERLRRHGTEGRSAHARQQQISTD